MTKLIFHIGWPKTGSTAIQQYMHKNAAVLERGGIYFPPNIFNPANPDDPHNAELGKVVRGAAHSAIFGELFDAKAVQRNGLKPGALNGAFANALEATQARGAHTLVLSNENVFWGTGTVSRAAFPAALFEHEVEVVAYYRRYDKYYPSLFKQLVKAGSTLDRMFEEFAAFRRRDKGATQPQPVSHAKFWRDEMGFKVSMRPYDQIGRGLIDDFLTLCGTGAMDQALRDEMVDPSAAQANPSFSDAVTLFVLELARRVPPPMLNRVRARLREINANGALQMDLPRLRLMSDETQAWLIEEYNRDQEELASEGFIEQATPIAPPAPDPDAPPFRDSLTTEELMTALNGLPKPMADRVRGRLKANAAS